jgi:hypothetical protein
MKTLREKLEEIFPDNNKILQENSDIADLIQQSEELLLKVISNNNKLLSSKDVMEKSIYNMNKLIDLTGDSNVNKKDS